jgi:DNA-binding CsgD family transcriptional regulator
MAASFAFDIISVLDALYAVDHATDTWVAGVLEVAERFLGQGRGVGVVRYDLSGDGPLRPVAIDGLGVSPDWVQVGLDQHRDTALASDIRSSYASVLSASARQQMSTITHASYLATMRRCRVADQWVINGVTPNGTGAALYLFAKAEIKFTAIQQKMLRALARHIGTAYRLQQRISRQPKLENVEEIFRPDGRIEHATAATESSATRHLLADAVSLRRWARGSAGRDAPAKALRAFGGLVNATWTLVDWFDRDGKRYVVACRNFASEIGIAALSVRESQVAMLARDGRSNKEIAYELRLAHSTVRVLLARAAVKLGTHSRAQLIRELARADSQSVSRD